MRLCLHAAAVGCRGGDRLVAWRSFEGGVDAGVVDHALGCSEWGTVRGVCTSPRADRCGSFVRRGRATCRALAVAATVVELVRSGWDGAGFGRCCGHWLCLEGRLQRCGGCWPYLSGQDRFRTIRRVLPCRGWDRSRLVQGGLFAGGGCGWSGDHRTAPPGLGSDRAGAAPCACAPRRPGQSGMGRGRVFAPVRRGWGGRGGCGAIALCSVDRGR